MPEAPELITFDIFGTVLDWRVGLESACRAAGRPIGCGEFDRIVDVQGELEQGEFLGYTEITARSLRQVLALDDEAAARIAAGVGDWPLYPDARAALCALVRIWSLRGDDQQRSRPRRADPATPRDAAGDPV